MSYFAALFRHRDPTPVRRVTLGALSVALGGENERAPAERQRPFARVEEDNSIHHELTGASLQLRADPDVPFLATLAPVTLGGDFTSSTMPHLRPTPSLASIVQGPQPFAWGGGLLTSGLGLA